MKDRPTVHTTDSGGQWVDPYDLLTSRAGREALEAIRAANLVRPVSTPSNKERPMKRFVVALLLVCLTACAPLHRAARTVRLVNPDPECERKAMRDRYGWTGQYVGLITFGDQTWAFEDTRVGADKGAVNFGANRNPFGCPNRPSRR